MTPLTCCTIDLSRHPNRVRYQAFSPILKRSRTGPSGRCFFALAQLTSPHSHATLTSFIKSRAYARTNLPRSARWFPRRGCGHVQLKSTSKCEAMRAGLGYPE